MVGLYVYKYSLNPILNFYQSIVGMKQIHGGFYPSIMGPFVANAEAAIVPAALYTAYHMFVPKNKSRSKVNMAKSRKNVSQKYRGSGYLTDQQWFNPDLTYPSADNHHSSYSTDTEIRPVLLSTYSASGGKKRKSRKNRKNRKVQRKSRKPSRK